MIFRYFTGFLLVFAASLLVAQGTLPLPAGNPPEEKDKCYAVCYIPAKFERVTESVQTYGADQRMLVAEPAYETYTERVMVKPASYQLVKVPAEYTTQEERVEVQPAYTEMVVEPAKFETVTERILVTEGATDYNVGQPAFETVTNAHLYYGNPAADNPAQYVSTDYGNILDPNDRKGVDSPEAPFNPNNPKSFISDPNSPLNVAPSLYTSKNGAGALFDPENPNSPFSATYIEANGVEAAQREATRLLQEAQVGTIAPYITTEARVKVDRIKRSYRTEPEQIEVSPAYYTYQELPVACETGDCVSFCIVEVPAQYTTVSKRIAEPCQEGYTPASLEQGGEEYCVRLSYEPAVYGARQVMVSGPEITERTIEPKYRDVQVQRMISPAKVIEREVPARYETVTKRVVSRPAYTRYELVPAEYKEVKRRVRTGLAGAEYMVPGGVFMAPTQYASTDGNEPTAKSGTQLPTYVNPAAGSKLPGSVLPYTLGSGPDRAGNIEPTGYAALNTNLNAGLEGMPDNFYTAGCPDGYRFDPLDGLCKSSMTASAESQTVTKQVLTGEGNFSEWVEVLCPQNTSRSSIQDIQQELNDRGYAVGTADGVMGPRTKAALAKFQRDNELPIGGMNKPTLEALGLR